MDIIIIPFLALLNSVIGIYVWIIIASVLMSWLVSFHVINANNNFVMMVMEFLYKVTEPILMRIRCFLPIIGGLDFSPLILILFLWFIQAVIGQLMIKITIGSSV